MGLLSAIFGNANNEQCRDALRLVKTARHNLESAASKLNRAVSNRLDETIHDMLQEHDNLNPLRKKHVTKRKT